MSSWASIGGELVRWVVGAFLLLCVAMPFASPMFWEPADDRRLTVRVVVETTCVIALAALAVPRPQRLDVRMLIGAAALVAHLTCWYWRWG